MSSLVHHLFFFDRFLGEYFVSAAIILLLVNGNILCRLASSVILSFILLVNLTQLTSLIRGGEFLSRLALDNINHISILFDKNILLLLCLILLLSFLPLWIISRAALPAAPRKSTLLSVCCLTLIALLFSLSHNWLPQTVQQRIDALFLDNNIRHSAPLYSLSRIFSHRDLTLFNQKFNRKELERLGDFGFHLNNERPYPLIHPTIYQGKLPFTDKKNSPADRPNIILFFNEGISARSLSIYGSQHKNITPHLADFAKSSMVIRNYYNHTAATYRGLHGQLCSMFPIHGGNGGWYPEYKHLSKTHYLSLPDLLNQEGYQTIFLDAHRKDKAYVNDMMKVLGFKKVWTAKEMSRAYLREEPPGQGDALSDTQLFRSLVGLLREKTTEKHDNKPFLLSLYNYGTHSWVNPTTDEVQYGDGNNQALNSIHNLDNAFGLFWKYFQQSPYADNTIIIFTTDHCHYPSQAYVATVTDQKYQRIFVDKVPFIIHDNRKALPQFYDSRNSTTLDLTPSLLHYLGIKNQVNPFLGHSIFSKKQRAQSYGVSNIPPDVFLIDEKKIHNRKNSTEHLQDIQLLERFVALNEILEGNDKLWQPATGE